jgi:hypothetical protein
VIPTGCTRRCRAVLALSVWDNHTLDLIARYGDACNVYGDLAEVRRKLDVLDRHCERSGRDPAEITNTVTSPASNIGLKDVGWATPA